MRLRAQLSTAVAVGAAGAALGLGWAWTRGDGAPGDAVPDWQAEVRLAERPIAVERWWRTGDGWTATRTYRWLAPDGAVVDRVETRVGVAPWGGPTDPWTGAPVTPQGEGWANGLVVVRPMPPGAAPAPPLDAAGWLSVPVERLDLGKHRTADLRFEGLTDVPEVPDLQRRSPGGVTVTAALAVEVPSAALDPAPARAWLAAVDDATVARARAVVGDRRGAAALAALAAAAAADVPDGFALGGGPVVGVPGDCTERATRLAALANALGWPARVASGLVYRDQPSPSLRPHAWAEIWRGRWFAVDPTEPGGLAGPTHVRLVGPDEGPERLITRLVAIRSVVVHLR